MTDRAAEVCRRMAEAFVRERVWNASEGDTELYEQLFLGLFEPILRPEMERIEQEWQARIGKTLKKVEEHYLLHNDLHWSEVVNIFGREFCQSKGATDANHE